jgi:hypothetical protein
MGGAPILVVTVPRYAQFSPPAFSPGWRSLLLLSRPRHTCLLLLVPLCWLLSVPPCRPGWCGSTGGARVARGCYGHSARVACVACCSRAPAYCACCQRRRQLSASAVVRRLPPPPLLPPLLAEPLAGIVAEMMVWADRPAVTSCRRLLHSTRSSRCRGTRGMRHCLSPARRQRRRPPLALLAPPGLHPFSCWSSCWRVSWTTRRWPPARVRAWCCWMGRARAS